MSPAKPKTKRPKAKPANTAEALAAAIAKSPDAYELTLGPEHWGPQCTRSGGKLAHIPHPRVRLFDVPGYQREIRINVTRYIAGNHYWVSIEEETNYLWDSGERTWAKAWDDRHADGRTYSEKFNTPESAEDFIKLVLKDNFSKVLYRVRRDWMTQGYGKEGD